MKTIDISEKSSNLLKFSGGFFVFFFNCKFLSFGILFYQIDETFLDSHLCFDLIWILWNLFYRGPPGFIDLFKAVYLESRGILTEKVQVFQLWNLDCSRYGKNESGCLCHARTFFSFTPPFENRGMFLRNSELFLDHIL